MILTQAGWIVADDAAIFGVGPTEDAAWNDLRRGMKLAKIPHESEVDKEDSFCPPYWTENRFRAQPATATLLETVEAYGGSIAWSVVLGVACTAAESEAAQDEEPSP
jgi:hypothetical protein